MREPDQPIFITRLVMEMLKKLDVKTIIYMITQIIENKYKPKRRQFTVQNAKNHYDLMYYFLINHMDLYTVEMLKIMIILLFLFLEVVFQLVYVVS